MEAAGILVPGVASSVVIVSPLAPVPAGREQAVNPHDRAGDQDRLVPFHASAWRPGYLCLAGLPAAGAGHGAAGARGTPRLGLPADETLYCQWGARARGGEWGLPGTSGSSGGGSSTIMDAGGLDDARLLDPANFMRHVHEGDRLISGCRYARGTEAFGKAVSVTPDALAGRVRVFLGAHRIHKWRNLETLELRTRFHSNPKLQEPAPDRDNDVIGFNECVAIDPSTNSGLIHLSSVLASYGSYNEALRQLEKVTAPDADCAGTRIKKAAILAYLGRHEAALAELEQAVRLEPKSVMGHVGMAYTLLDMGRSMDALCAFSDAALLDPDSAEAHQGRGRALLALGRAEEARIALDEATRLEPGNAGTRLSLGRALLYLHRAGDALVELDEATRLDPDSARARQARGRALLALGREGEALEALDAADRLEPGNAMTLLCRGNALFNLGRAKESLEALNAADRLDPGNALTLLCRGHAHRALGNHHEAIDDMDRSARLDPTIGVPPYPGDAP